MTSIGWYVVSELASRHEVTLYAFRESGDEQWIPKFDALKVQTRLFDRPARSLWQYYLTPGPDGWFQRQWHSLLFAQQTKVADQSGTFDLMVVHSPFMSAYLRLITTTPVILHAFDALSSWFRQMADVDANPLKRWHLRQEATKAAWAEQHLYPQAKAIVAVSERDAAVFQAAAPTSTTIVIPIGVDTNAFAATSSESDEPTLMFTGVMNYQPNVDAVRRFARDVWPELRTRWPDLRWKIVGKNPTPEVLALETINSGITVTGFVPDMAATLHQATIIIAPLNIGTGFKIKMIEALAAGKAIVSSPDSLPGLALRPGEDVLVARTPTEWVDHISNLLTDPNTRRKIEQHARQHAEQFSWPMIAHRYEQLYASVTR